MKRDKRTASWVNLALLLCLSLSLVMFMAVPVGSFAASSQVASDEDASNSQESSDQTAAYSQSPMAIAPLAASAFIDQSLEGSQNPIAIAPLAATVLLVSNQSELFAALDKAKTSGLETTIELTKDIEVDQQVIIQTATDVTLTGAYTLSRIPTAQRGTTLFVTQQGSLTLDGPTITHTGNAVGSGVYVAPAASFHLISGKIINNHTTQGAGVENRGTFIMSGGEISGNVADTAGGGVYNIGQFTMTGGLIANNSTAASGNGGGIWNNVSGGTGANPGNVWDTTGRSFVITGGQIIGNQAKDGAGLYLQLSAADRPTTNYIALSGVQLTNNTAAEDGGAIWLDQSQLNKLFIAPNVGFSGNSAAASFGRLATDDQLYANQVLATAWSADLTQGYNNFDISYHGVSHHLVGITGSYANNSGAGDHYATETVNIDAGSRAGYNFTGWTVDAGAVSLANPQSAQTSFRMPDNVVQLTANWEQIPADFGTPAAIDVTYAPGLTLNDLVLPTGYTWDAPDTVLTVGSGQSFAATYTDPDGIYAPGHGSVTVNVAKAQGATVAAVAAPIASTTDSLTIAAVAAPDNGQSVEYGICAVGEDGPSSWQSGTTFTDLSEATQYVIYARSAANDNYNAGTPSTPFVANTQDVTDPEAAITIKASFFNALTASADFTMFFQDSLNFGVSAADDGAGIASVQYYLATDVLAADTDYPSLDWTTITTFEPEDGFGGPASSVNVSADVDANWKGLIYVMVTDFSGNYVVIDSAGIVVYTDAQATAAAISFDKASPADSEATVAANGNTVDQISNAGDVLTLGSDYTVSGGTISFKTAYLAGLDNGDYSLVVSYKPLGEDYVDAFGNDEPSTTTIPLAVSGLIPQAALSITGLSASYTYGDADFQISVAGGSGTGEVSFSSSDPTVASVSGNTVSIHKAGSFTITATKAADAVYDVASVTSDEIEVSEDAPLVSVQGDNVAYGNDVVLTISVTGAGDAPEGTVVLSEGSTTLATLDLIAGAASYTVTLPQAGNHTYTVEYTDASGLYAPGHGSVTVNVAKAQGATVAAVAAPIASTTDSLTIAAVAAPDNGQSVEYGICAVGEDGPSSWQSGTTFTDLSEATQYVIYARSAANDNYNAGTPSTPFVANTQDVTDPEAAITIKASFFNALTASADFTMFFQDSLNFGVSAADDGAGIASVQYYLATDVLAADTDYPSLDWTTITTFEPEDGFGGPASSVNVSADVDANWKGLIYVMVTDFSGNYVVIDSAGIVVYTDAQATAAAISFDKASPADSEATVAANGNTVDQISNAGDVLTLGSDYTVSGGTISFKTAYLAGLDNGDYSLVVSYKPLGEDYVDAFGNDEPSTTTIPLAVSGLIPQAALSITGLSASYTYGDADFQISVAGGSGTGEVSFSSSDPTVASVSGNTVSIHKAGSFTITATKAADAVYDVASVTSDEIEVSEDAPLVSVQGDNVAYGNDVVLTISVTGAGDAPEGTVVLSEGSTTLATLDLIAGAASYTVTLPQAGNHTYTVEYSGQSDYYASASASAQVGVGKIDQEPFAIDNPGVKTYGDADFQLSTSGGSGDGEVTFSVPDEAVISVTADGVVSIHNAGTAQLIANKAGDLNFNSAEATLDITIARRDIANTVVLVTGATVYTGSQLQPSFTVVDSALTVDAGDYNNTYGENVTVAQGGTIVVNGQRNYTGSVTKNFDIKKATPPEVVFPTPSDITYSPTQTLADIALTGSGDGSFSWADGSIVPTVNSVGYVVIFTPNDSANYDYSGMQLSQTVAVTVNKADPPVLAPVDIQATYGDKLSSIKLPDGWIWQDDSETARPVGSRVYKAMYIPTDLDNYNSKLDVDVTIQVEPLAITVSADNQSKYLGAADPALTWTVKPALLAGDRLSGSLKYSGTAVGSYPIVEDLAFTNPNYKISFVPGTMTIKNTPAVEAVMDEIEALPDPVKTIADADQVAEVTKAYEALTPEQKAQVADSDKQALTKAQTEAGLVNHHDATNKVTVSGDYLPWYVRLKVIVIPQSHPDWPKFVDKLDDHDLIVLFDIYLENSLTGADFEIPAGQTVTVQIDNLTLPEGKTISVAHAKKDGTVEILTATVEGQSITFIANSFSDYGVITPTVADPAPGPGGDDSSSGNGPVPGTGDTSFWLWLGAGILALAAAVIIWRRLRAEQGR